MGDRIKGRAETPDERRVIAGRIMLAWTRWPHLRLGQFISNALHAQTAKQSGPDLFSIEDEALAECCERFTGKEAPNAG